MPNDTPNEIPNEIPDVPPEDSDPTSVTPPDRCPNVPAGAEPRAELHFPPGYEPLEACYKPVKELAKGGMGVVFQAREIALERHVAIKFLLEQYDSTSNVARRFREEAGITAQLQHPNIPPVYSVGTAPSGRPYLVMKLVKGKTLSKLLEETASDHNERVAQRGRLLGIFEGVAQAVGYAHARKVIHRDLKPANVMVGAFGEVQVMDWGLAKLLGTEPRPDLAPEADESVSVIFPPLGPDERVSLVGGTPQYMSPEQAGREHTKVDCRADVFALGGILCRILTGAAPYNGQDKDAVLLKAVRCETAEALDRLGKCGADSELIELAKWCLAREPKERPADAGAVATAVAEWRAAAEERAHTEVLKSAAEEAARRAAEEGRERAKQLYLLALGGYNHMVFEVQAKLARRSGTLDLQQQVLSVARTGLQQLVGEAEKHGTPDRTLIWTHSQMGDVLLALGDTSKAQDEYGTARALAGELADAGQDDARAQQDLSVSLSKVGAVALLQGRTDEARELFGNALDVLRRLAAADPSDAQVQRDLSVSLERMGDVALKQGRADEAREFFDQALVVSRRLADADPSDAQARRDLLVSYYKFGQLAKMEGDFARAIEFYTQARGVASAFTHPAFFVTEIAILEECLTACRQKLSAVPVQPEAPPA